MLKPPYRILKSMFALIILLALITKVIAPWEIRRQILSMLKESCTSCRLSIGKIDFSLFPVQVVFHDLHLRAGDAKATGVEVLVSEVAASIAPEWLVFRQFHLRNVAISTLDVIVTEGDQTMPPRRERREEESRWTFRLDRTVLRDGRFTYLRRYSDHEARLHLNRIEGEIGELGTTEALLEKKVEAEVKATLENSGRVDVKVASQLFSQRLNLNVDLVVEDQKLSALNPFFRSSEGITLKGDLLNGRGTIAVNDRHLSGWLKARYQKLDIDFEKTGERGPITAFFTNLIAGMKVNETNTDSRKRDQVRPVQLDRKPDEALLHFIFRGLKEAALKVATA